MLQILLLYVICCNLKNFSILINKINHCQNSYMGVHNPAQLLQIEVKRLQQLSILLNKGSNYMNNVSV